MMTGNDDVASIRRAYEAGATDFVTKPINWLILSHRVRYLLRASDDTGELRRSRERLASAQRLARIGSFEYDPETGALLATTYSALRVRYGWPRISAYNRWMSASRSGRGCRAFKRATCSGEKS